jgi:quinone-reactive Ni/Fe-hydrogenase large subunit
MKETREFIQNAYLPDIHMLAGAYMESMKNGDGKGLGNFLATGGYTFGKKQDLFESGVVFDHHFETLEDFDRTLITEHVERSWYEDDESDLYKTRTEAFYTDLNDDGSLKTEGKYSWVKSPRYKGKAMEVGPLARMIVGYLKDSPIIKPVMQEWMDKYDLELIDFSSTIGRTVARAIEAEICNEYIFDYINDLLENIKYYNEETWTKYSFEALEQNTRGNAVYEVPRGVLSHFIDIKDAKINNYQVIAPTTWNASPRDNTQRGPYEESLIGIKLNDPNNPLEVLRVVHSFDPCLACAVHVMDMKGNSISEYKIKPACSTD